MVETRTNQELLIDIMKATTAAADKKDEFRCTASVMRGHRCKNRVVSLGTLCASHVAMGW